MINVTTFICGLLTLLFGVASVYLLPWLKAKLGAERFVNVAYWVGVFVSAAEQLFKGTGRGAEKRAYVVERLAAMGFVLDTDAVRALIEAQVRELTADAMIVESVTVKVDATAEEVAGWQEEAPPDGLS